jgi:hypothetical protein
MTAVAGPNTYVVARRTPRLVARCGADTKFLSPKAYAAAKAKAIETRGWARPVEKVILDLIEAVKEGPAYPIEDIPAVKAAREALKHARTPT